MIRCLIVDDSPTFRQVMRDILAKAPDVEVVGEAGDGDEAITKTLRLFPDAITMDVQMPRKDGLKALAEIMERQPTPVIVVCAGANDESLGIGFRALELGAVEVFQKPQAEDRVRFAAQADAIREAVRAVTRLKPLMIRPRAVPARAALRLGARQAVACVGIAASTGGPAALQKILSALPAKFPAPILVVQHIAPGFSEGLTRWLGEHCALKLRSAKNDDPLSPGTILFAPDEGHLIVSMGRVRIDEGPAIRGHRPSATALFASLARELGSFPAAGLILTGMGEDGVTGLKLLRDRGGITLAQGPASSTIYGMPRAAIETGAAEFSLELDEIPEVLVQLTRFRSP